MIVIPAEAAMTADPIAVVTTASMMIGPALNGILWSNLLMIATMYATGKLKFWKADQTLMLETSSGLAVKM